MLFLGLLFQIEGAASVDRLEVVKIRIYGLESLSSGFGVPHDVVHLQSSLGPCHSSSVQVAFVDLGVGVSCVLVESKSVRGVHHCVVSPVCRVGVRVED